MSSPVVENKANDAKPQREQKKEFRRKGNSASFDQKANGQQNGSPQNGHSEKKQNKKDDKKGSDVNERFDNSALLAAEGDNARDPSLSHKVSESKRMNDIVTPGLPAEVVNKVKKIQEMFPNFEFHHIYAVLERCRFDEQDTVNMLMETARTPEPQKHQQKSKQQHQQQHQQHQQHQQQPKAIKDQLAGTPWASVVKGAADQPLPQHHQAQQPQHPLQQQHQHQQPQQPQQPQQHQQVSQQQQMLQQQLFNFAPSPLLQGMMNPMMGVSTPEDVVNRLSVALNEQLEAIMEKSRQLMAMQEELQKIQTNDKSEMQQLLDRKAQLQDEQRRLHDQLRQNEINLQQVEEQINAKGREKTIALQTLTVKGAELGVVEIPHFPAAQTQAVPQYATQPQQVYHEQPQQQQQPVDVQQQQAFQQYNGHQNGQQRNTNKGGNRAYNNNGNFQQQQNRGGRQSNRY